MVRRSSPPSRTISVYKLQKRERDTLGEVKVPADESLLGAEFGFDENGDITLKDMSVFRVKGQEIPFDQAVEVDEALLRLRQASCHSALVPGQSAATSSKVERLVESLEDAAADGHKALVFSQWTSFLDLIEPHLREAGVAFTRLDGSTRDRAGVVAEFQDANGPPVMLVSLKAGGTGLNLTAADHVFLMDPWWNPAVEDQAADRAHRIGQDKPVMVYRLVTKDTVEERILLLQERKRSLAGAALGEADRALSLTREDLMDLLA